MMIRRLTFSLLALFLSSCLPALPDATLVPSPLPATATATATFAPTDAPIPSPTATETPPPHPAIARVLIVSMDGLRPDAIDLAPMPVLQSLMQTGAYSLSAQTIFPSTTLPAHSSMLSGLCPSAHGVFWDTYEPDRGYALGTDLFDIAHAAALRTVMVVGKKKLVQLIEPPSLDVFQWVNDPDQVVAARAALLMPEGFGVFFVHLPNPDQDGHDYGWLSTRQLLTLRRTDDALQTLLTALDDAGLRQDTLVIVSADHGGHSTSHGFDIPADMTIPWVVNGPGVRPGPLLAAINTTDTAATAAWALNLSIPAEWSGLPVLEAFGVTDGAVRAQPRCP